MTQRSIIRRLRFDRSTTVTYQDGLVEFLGELGKCFRLDPTRQVTFQKLIGAQSCPHCGDALREVNREAATTSLTSGLTWTRACDLCWYWQRYEQTADVGKFWTLPSLASFTPQRQIPALSGLLSQLQKDEGRLYQLSPKQFELAVGSILSDITGSDVFHVGGSGDGGIDLLVVAGEHSLAVQVKRRQRQNAVEGIDVVRTMFASLAEAGMSDGMVVTTAQRFTQDAKEWIHLPNLRDWKFNIDLIDVGRLMEMVRAIAPANQLIPPWEMAQTHEEDGTEQVRVDRIESGEDELVLHCSGSLSGLYRFEANARDCCWKIDESNVPSDRTNLFESSGNEPKEIAGRDFTRLLTLLPNAAHEALLVLWTLGDKPRIVDFEW